MQILDTRSADVPAPRVHVQGVSKEMEAKSENLHGCCLHVRSSRFRESICPSIYLSIYCLTFYQSICLSFIIHRSIHLSISPIGLSV